MDYQLIIFLSKKELMAVDITEDGDCEEVSIDGNASMKYSSTEDFKDFAQYICDAYNVDTIEEMEAGATIVNCGADADTEIALMEQLKDFKGIDCIDVKKLLPIVAQQKGLLQKGSKQIVSVMGNCFAVKCDDDGVATVGKYKVTDAVELTGVDFAFLYFFKSEGNGVSEEEINKYKAELEAVKADAAAQIAVVKYNADKNLNEIKDKFAQMESEYQKYKKFFETIEAQKAAENDKFKGATIGSIIKFGQYYKEDEKTKADIEWLVLDVDDDKVFVVSKYIIEQGKFAAGSQAYQEYYDESLVRRWLNNQFCKIAFTKEETNRIIPTKMKYDRFQDSVDITDKLFLLSTDEIHTYIGDKLTCQSTAYVKQSGVYAVTSNQVWWTRECSYLRHYVVYNSFIDDDWKANVAAGIRPAMWLRK